MGNGVYRKHIKKSRTTNRTSFRNLIKSQEQKTYAQDFLYFNESVKQPMLRNPIEVNQFSIEYVPHDCWPCSNFYSHHHFKHGHNFFCDEWDFDDAWTTIGSHKANQKHCSLQCHKHTHYGKHHHEDKTLFSVKPSID